MRGRGRRFRPDDTNQSLAAMNHDQAMVLAAQANTDLADANLAAAQARLQLDNITLGYTVLSAPFSGVIAVREAELGERAGPGVAISRWTISTMSGSAPMSTNPISAKSASAKRWM